MRQIADFSNAETLYLSIILVMSIVMGMGIIIYSFIIPDIYLGIGIIIGMIFVLYLDKKNMI